MAHMRFRRATRTPCCSGAAGARCGKQTAWKPTNFSHADSRSADRRDADRAVEPAGGPIGLVSWWLGGRIALALAMCRCWSGCSSRLRCWLENDRRLRELSTLREAAEADKRSLLARVGPARHQRHHRRRGNGPEARHGTGGSGRPDRRPVLILGEKPVPARRSLPERFTIARGERPALPAGQLRSDPHRSWWTRNSLVTNAAALPARWQPQGLVRAGRRRHVVRSTSAANCPRRASPAAAHPAGRHLRARRRRASLRSR